ncbi:hypothetical protein [environmental halophage 1 AAJ-2005]|nr:hypothetical protein [environmental halophage 1 AAJ-2005]
MDSGHLTQLNYYDSVSESATEVATRRETRAETRADSISHVVNESKWVHEPQLAIKALDFSGNEPVRYTKYASNSPDWKTAVKAMAYAVYEQDVEDELRRREMNE